MKEGESPRLAKDPAGEGSPSYGEENQWDPRIHGEKFVIHEKKRSRGTAVLAS